MLLIEPESARRTRLHYATVPPSLPILEVVRGPHADLIERHTTFRGRPPQPLGEAFWVDVILETVETENGYPTRITSIVNAVSRIGGYSTRALRDAARIRLFKLIGGLIRSGRLRRVARKYVVIGNAPATPANASVHTTVGDLPLPVL